MHLSNLLLLVAAALPSTARTFIEAIGAIPDLSNFTAFYSANELFASTIFGNQSLYPITVLVPSDYAFATYQAQTGQSLTDLPVETLLTLIQYHTLVSSLSKENLTSSNSGSGTGMTTPTLLVDGEYNNRSVGSSLAAKFGGAEKSKGQVVFISPSGSSSTKLLLRRQAGGSSSNTVRSGLYSIVNVTALDDDQGAWDGGRFHIIDGLLTPPDTCKKTIRGASLTSLDRALNRSGLWNALDSSKNITCLGPSNDAFSAAASPDQNATDAELVKALLFHTLPQVAYSDYLEDGMEFTSLQNMTVRVKIEGTGKDREIYFNNAKVVDANVLTHNGLMHVLDAVMTPLNDSNATTSGTASSTVSATATGSPTRSATGAASSTAAAVAMGIDPSNWGTSGLVGVVAMALLYGMGML